MQGRPAIVPGQLPTVQTRRTRARTRHARGNQAFTIAQHFPIKEEVDRHTDCDSDGPRLKARRNKVTTRLIFNSYLRTGMLNMLI